MTMMATPTRIVSALAVCLTFPSLGFASQTLAPSYWEACIHNETGRSIEFRYDLGNGQWRNVTLPAGFVQVLSKQLLGGGHAPKAVVEMDIDATQGRGWTPYGLALVRSPGGNNCNAVPAAGHFAIAFRPGTNNQFLHMVQRGPTALQPPPTRPPQAQGPCPPGKSLNRFNVCWSPGDNPCPLGYVHSGSTCVEDGRCRPGNVQSSTGGCVAGCRPGNVRINTGQCVPG